MQIRTTVKSCCLPTRMARQTIQSVSEVTEQLGFFVFIFLIKKLKQFYIGVYLINSVMLVSGVQQSDSIIHIQVSILFQILFPFWLLQNIEQSSLCYSVGPCWLSILNIVVCTCVSQTPSISLPAPFPLVTISLFSKSMSVSVL